jgi:hypothetical protein
MSALVQTPLDLLEEVAVLRFPAKADRHLQELMDRNNDGKLSTAQREELEALVELSEKLSLVRARVLQCLGRRP